MAENQLTAGSVLNGRYKIASLLGKGGAGAVYKALDLTNNQYIALKLLLTGEDSSTDLTKQKQFFQREVALLQRVSHPNIIGVIDSGVTDTGKLFLVLEY